jgi:hypothetical protein
MADAVHRVTVDPDVGLLAALLAVEGREGRETCQENKFTEVKKARYSILYCRILGKGRDGPALPLIVAVMEPKFEIISLCRWKRSIFSEPLKV